MSADIVKRTGWTPLFDYRVQSGTVRRKYGEGVLYAKVMWLDDRDIDLDVHFGDRTAYQRRVERKEFERMARERKEREIDRFMYCVKNGIAYH